MTHRKALMSAIAITALALVALLVYSLERTAWLFGLFESWVWAARAAAVVVEIAAVALLVGGAALAHLDASARAWANRALVAVLSVSALANLSAGYLRGGYVARALFTSSDDWRFWSAYAVAASLWLVTNLAVPALILCLSKLLERLIVAVVSLEPTPSLEHPSVTISAPERAALQAPASARALTDEAHRWACPRCGQALTSGRALGAAKTNNGCKACRMKEVA